MPKSPQRFLPRPWARRALPAGVAAILVVAGTAVTHANANASAVDAYRTTAVTTGSVEQRLNLTGSVQRVSQVTQSFAVAGTVTSVAVSVGDTVTAGQPLATIDPGPLRSAVVAAQATLAKGKATLESDQSATPAASSGTGGATGATGATTVTPAATATPLISPRVATPPGRSGAGASKSLAQAQQRVASAQNAIATDLSQASAALTSCMPFFPTRPPATAVPRTASPMPTASTTTAPTTTAPTTAASPTASAPSDAATKACIAALGSAPTQQRIRRDQEALTRGQSALMTSVTLAITTAGNVKASTLASSPAATGPSSTSGSSASQSSTSRSSTSRSSTSQSATNQSTTSQSSGGSSPGQTGGAGQSTASRVISDQAAITTAQDALSIAQANLTTATLTSSINGTVGSLSLVKGTSSASTNIVIVGPGAVEVTVDVPLASMASVRVGQKADVTPQGATSSAPGAVTSIGLLPSTATSTNTAGRATSQGTGSAAQTSATSSSPVYPMVVLVSDALPALASGSRADVSLLIGTAAMVLTVPNSALTPLGNGQALAVTLKNGVATRAVVKTGYAGTLLTQVMSGLTAGQHVVLADLSTALPTNTTNSRRLGVGGAATGGLGGAGLGGAGLGGAGLGGGAAAGGGGFASRG